MNDKDIEYLKTLKENSGQVLEIHVNGKTEKFLFMWFFYDGIDVRLPGSISILHINPEHFINVSVVYK